MSRVPRKRTTVRLTTDNYSYLNDLANERDSSLCRELNRVLKELRRQSGVTKASTVAGSRQVN